MVFNHPKIDIMEDNKMESKYPRVSIGLPVYNGEKFLRSSLESLLSQNFTDFELIISDNASTDATPTICKEYAGKDPRIIYTRKDKNSGAVDNFNTVFELSRGEYFAWAADDDLYDPEFLRQCVEALDKEPDVILCYPKSKIIDEFDNVVKNHEEGLNMVSDSPSARFLQTFCNRRLGNPFYGLIRASVLRDKKRLLRDVIGFDFVLLAELSLLGKFREIPNYMYYRRIHSGNAGCVMLVNDEVIGKSKNGGLVDDDVVKFHFSKSKIVFPRCRGMFEHLLLVNRAPIRLTDKMFLSLFLLGFAIRDCPKYFKEIKVNVNKAASQIFGSFRYAGGR
jgi:glycosyltransferase involved in cell wall biosynthesis